MLPVTFPLPIRFFHQCITFSIGGHVYFTLQNYTTMSSNNNCNNASTEQALTQNFPQPFMNISTRTITPPEIITCVIPGYDVIFIPKSSSYVNSNNLNM